MERKTIAEGPRDYMLQETLPPEKPQNTQGILLFASDKPAPRPRRRAPLAAGSRQELHSRQSARRWDGVTNKPGGEPPSAIRVDTAARFVALRR